MKKVVAIIGAAGNVGSAIAWGLAAAGYRILLTDEIEHHASLYVKLLLREREIKLGVPVADVGIVPSAREASWEADIIILATPLERQAEIACAIRDVVTGKIIMSLANPLYETHNGPVTASAHDMAQELAHLLPHSKIVRAFSIMVAGPPEEPAIAGLSIDGLVSGHDEEAVSTLMQLATDVVRHPLRAGKPDGPGKESVSTPRSSGNERTDSSPRKAPSQ